jgi:hypothetical protein
VHGYRKKIINLLFLWKEVHILLEIHLILIVDKKLGEEQIYFANIVTIQSKYVTFEKETILI